MRKTDDEIRAKIEAIYALARSSDMPISVLSKHSITLMAHEGWEPVDVERVSGEVMSMLIRHGWKKLDGNGAAES